VRQLCRGPQPSKRLALAQIRAESQPPHPSLNSVT
jgi:hypothetical protein